MALAALLALERSSAPLTSSASIKRLSETGGLREEKAEQPTPFSAVIAAGPLGRNLREPEDPVLEDIAASIVGPTQRLYQSSTAILEHAASTDLQPTPKEETMTYFSSSVSTRTTNSKRIDLGGLGIVWKLVGAAAVLAAAILASTNARAALSGAPPGVKAASVAGASLAYRSTGSGRALLLINGSGATLDTWDPKLVHALTRFRRVIVYDPRGLGHSTGHPQSVTSDARDAAELLATLGVQRADVLGWSYGGFVAQQLAIDKPALVTHLILISTDHGGPTAVRAPSQTRMLDDKVTLGAATPTEILKLLFPRQAFAIGGAWLARLSAQPGSCCEHVSRSAAKRVITSERRWYTSGAGTRPHLPAIVAPTLVIAGSADIDVPPVNARLLAARIPDAQLMVVPTAGHAVLYQAEHQVELEIRHFLG